VVPPSVGFIIYASVSGTSVGKLFLAGAIPGLLLAVGMIGVSAAVAYRKGHPGGDRHSASAIGKSFVSALPALAMPVVILGGIFGGIVTPTEAGAVAVGYGLLVGLVVYRSLRLCDLPGILFQATKQTSSILVIIAGAACFGFLISRELDGGAIVGLFSSLTQQRWVLMLVLIGIILGFTGGFMGGWVDDFIRLIADVNLTIPALMVLIVLNSVFDRIDLITMAVIISAFAWARPTRQIRAQVLTMRESGYVRMARLSGASSFDIMFREMLPNLIPYLFASFISGATGAILAAVGLETLGLGPQGTVTLGGTIYDAYTNLALSGNLWWWWGVPTVLLSIMFVGLLLINLGLDEVANPRLRRGKK